ncbi:hypothetical protein SAMN05518855_1005152 [Paenibacillus sp. CF384]|nr:hypothetical protein SAMN05518855_1005152 [Paenibacillus sp. CF384]
MLRAALKDIYNFRIKPVNKFDGRLVIEAGDTYVKCDSCSNGKMRNSKSDTPTFKVITFSCTSCSMTEDIYIKSRKISGMMLTVGDEYTFFSVKNKKLHSVLGTVKY